MSDSLVERMAKRLHRLAPARFLSGVDRRGHTDWLLMRDSDKENYIEAARALIAEMRVPDEHMKAQGDKIAAPSIVIWQAMIDGGLAER